jgi:hypothetical protein
VESVENPIVEHSYVYVKNIPTKWKDSFGFAIGDFPPQPPGYSPVTWKLTMLEGADNYLLTNPEGTKYRMHKEDEGHWRHWDVLEPGADKQEQYPPGSGKQKPDQAKCGKNQSKTDPNGDASPWDPSKHMMVNQMIESGDLLYVAPLLVNPTMAIPALDLTTPVIRPWNIEIPFFRILPIGF